MQDQVEEELELELSNSLALRLHPSLRRAQLRKLADQTGDDKKKGEARRAEKRRRAEVRTKLRGKFLQALQEKVKSQSRQEAFEEMQPQARQKSGKKPSLVLKPSAKSHLEGKCCR